MAAPTDVLLLKTEAELRFFVENPAYYHPDLVAAAQRELRRRGISPTPLPAPEVSALSSGPYPEEAPRRIGWLVPAAGVAVLLLAGLGFWKTRPATTLPPRAAATARRTRPTPPPHLETAVASPLPTYDTDAYVEKALALVPARERANQQLASQYRAISRRFWAAQNPSAHLIRQAQQGQTTPVFGAQAELTLSLWHDFDRALVYSYTFGPGMADHLDRMKRISQCQRRALAKLASDFDVQHTPRLDDARLLADQAALPHLLAPLEHHVAPGTMDL